MNSLTRLTKYTISIPDYSRIFKRSISLPRHVLSQAMQLGSLVIVDATVLKVYGKDEWHQEKHDVAARRTWRELHTVFDKSVRRRRHAVVRISVALLLRVTDISNFAAGQSERRAFDSDIIFTADITCGIMALRPLPGLRVGPRAGLIDSIAPVTLTRAIGR
jgi:hypothetical protein